MASHKKQLFKLVKLFMACLLIEGCTPFPSIEEPSASIIRPTQERRHVPLIGGTVLALGHLGGSLIFGSRK